MRLRVNLGRTAGVRPGDLVGMIANESGISSRELGAIEIATRHSLVEVPAARADQIIEALKAATLRGRRAKVCRNIER